MSHQTAPGRPQLALALLGVLVSGETGHGEDVLGGHASARG